MGVQAQEFPWASAVEAVPQNGVSRSGEVEPDLMRAAGQGLGMDQGPLAAAEQNPEPGCGGFPLALGYRGVSTLATADIVLPAPGIPGRESVDARQVFLEDLPVLEGFAELPVGPGIQGENHDTAGFPVQAMVQPNSEAPPKCFRQVA